MVNGGDNHSRESELMCSQIMKAKPENPELVKKSKEDFGSGSKTVY